MYTKVLSTSFWKLSLFCLFSSGIVYANSTPPANTMEQRVKACIACHDAQGKATNEGYYPRIAGKPEGYLYNQLLNFQHGRRTYPAMNYMVRHLPNDYLKDIARYFSEQHPPYPPSQKLSLSAQQVERAKTLVTMGDKSKSVPACMSCHGNGLMGVAPFVPAVIGLPSAYLYAQLSNWKDGRRQAAKPDCMAAIVGKLSNEDMVIVTNWLGSQPVSLNAQAENVFPEKTPLLTCGSITK